MNKEEILSDSKIIDIIIKPLRSHPADIDIAEAIVKALKDTNCIVIKKGKAHQELRGEGEKDVCKCNPTERITSPPNPRRVKDGKIRKCGRCLKPLSDKFQYENSIALQKKAQELRGEGWISVEDRLPENGKCVMIYSENGGVAEGSYLAKKCHFEQWRWSCIKENVTHWKPLPAPPNG